MNQVEFVTRRNMKRTRLLVVLSFVCTTVVNLALIGYFARMGGMHLVGVWALLGAVVLNILVLDFGFTNGLTYRIGRDGLDAATPLLRRILEITIVVFVSVTAAALIGWGLGGLKVAGLLFACSAGLAQLMSGWLIAIRMGQHEQYWFNIKTIVRVVAQGGAAYFFVVNGTGSAEFDLGIALFLGGVCELTLAVFMVKKQLQLSRPAATFRDVKTLFGEFGMESVFSRATQPAIQYVIGATLGPVALGMFSVALRIPVVLNQAVAEALRALLPGLASLHRAGSHGAVTRLLRDAILSQAVLILPPSIALFFWTDPLLEVWLGPHEATTKVAVRLFLVSYGITSLFTPYFWATQAAGSAQLIGQLTGIRLGAVLLLSFAAFSAGAGVIAIATIFSAGNIAFAVAVGLIAHQRYNFVAGSLLGLRTFRVFTYLAFVAALNGILFNLLASATPLWGLVVGVTANVIMISVIAFPAIRLGYFLHCTGSDT